MSNHTQLLFVVFLSMTAQAQPGPHAPVLLPHEGGPKLDCNSCAWQQQVRGVYQDRLAPPPGVDPSKLEGYAHLAAACGGNDLTEQCGARDEAACRRVNACEWIPSGGGRDEELDRCVPKEAVLRAENRREDVTERYRHVLARWAGCLAKTKDKRTCESKPECRWIENAPRCKPRALPFTTTEASRARHPKACCLAIEAKWDEKQNRCIPWQGPVNDCLKTAGKKGFDSRIYPIPQVTGYDVDYSKPSYFALPQMRNWCKSVRHVYNGHGVPPGLVMSEARELLVAQPGASSFQISNNSCESFIDLRKSKEAFLRTILPEWRRHPLKPTFRVAANQTMSADHHETERTNTAFVFAILPKGGGKYRVVQYPGRCHEGPLCEKEDRGASYLCRLPSTNAIDEFEEPPDFSKLAREKVVRRTCRDDRWQESAPIAFDYDLGEE